MSNGVYTSNQRLYLGFVGCLFGFLLSSCKFVGVFRTVLEVDFLRLFVLLVVLAFVLFVDALALMLIIVRVLFGERDCLSQGSIVKVCPLTLSHSFFG